MATENKIHLYYWAATGKAQTIRYLLEHLSLSYEETRYTTETSVQWFTKDKAALQMDFPNLPSLVDGDFKISENQAISSYLPERAGQAELNGKGKDRFVVDQIKSLVDDLMVRSYIANQKGGEEKDKMFNEMIAPKIQYILNFVSKQKEFALGYLTVADFYIYALTRGVQINFTTLFEQQFGGKFQEFWTRFETLPKIATYMQTEKHIKYEAPKTN